MSFNLVVCKRASLRSESDSSEKASLRSRITSVLGLVLFSLMSLATVVLAFTDYWPIELNSSVQTVEQFVSPEKIVVPPDLFLEFTVAPDFKQNMHTVASSTDQ